LPSAAVQRLDRQPRRIDADHLMSSRATSWMLAAVFDTMASATRHFLDSIDEMLGDPGEHVDPVDRDDIQSLLPATTG
jgi:hypothetical protein